MDITGLFEQILPILAEGNEHLWDCFGKNSWSIDVGTRVWVIYDVKTRLVYQITFYDYVKDYDFATPAPAYVWTNSEYRQKYQDEREKRNITDDNLFTEININMVEIINKIKEHQDGQLD